MSHALRPVRAAILLSALSALAACDSGRVSERPPQVVPVTPAPVIATSRAELGEVVEGYPDDQERMVLVLTNLARHAGVNECGDYRSEPYVGPNVKKTPLVHTNLGNRGARFTSKHMSELGCFQHESCCVLGNVGGNVECTAPGDCSSDMCGAECTGGSPIEQRYSLLKFATFSGENIARGYASAREVWCGWMNSPGHRANIYSGHTELGVGMVQSPSSCGRYWTQAFGSGNVQVPRIPAASAIHAPPNPQSTLNFHFAANYYDSSGQAPRRAAVVVNGHCFDLERKWGFDDNGTYEAHFDEADDIPAGCQPYYFLFVDADANRWTYPDNGMLYLPLGTGVTCPKSYDAVPHQPADCESGVQQCTEGATQTCYTGPTGTENVGVCHAGFQVCKNGFWSACANEKRPGNEVCDGLDNNCDGTVDDGNPGGGADCSVPIERGICKAGKSQCIAGATVCVSATQPQPEICDGLDNDCDGEVDDALPVLTCGKGECFRMVPSCILGVEQTCVEGEPSVEIADHKDNDCDGIVDDEIECRKMDGTGVGVARQCYSFPLAQQDGGTSTIQLPCKRGIQTCQEDGGWSECVGEVGPSPEICDGQDNDCDGDTDEPDELGWQRCGIGACTAFTQECRFGKPNVCTPGNASAEVCNGIDDSCNGEVDEGCSCRDGNAFACYSGPLGTSDAGTCQAGLNTCVGGQWSGCAGEVLPGTEYCDGEDNDCDGEVDNACVPPPADGGTDAGTGGGLPDGGTDGDGTGGGCGCAAGTNGSGVLLLLAFALPALFSRRAAPRPR